MTSIKSPRVIPPNARSWQQLVFDFPAGSTTSTTKFLGYGAFGTLLVPSTLNGKTLQFVTDITSDTSYSNAITTPANFDGINLLATAITLATGANALSSDAITQAGAAGPIKLKLNSAPVAAEQIVLWWKA